MRSRMAPLAVVLGVAALAAGGALAGAAIQDDDPDGGPIPTDRTPPPAPAEPLLTASGAPQVTQFAVPERFWCLPAHPGQAQVTVGWHVPSATHVAVLLDGRRLKPGIRKRPPFAVLAGRPSGIGATVVFRCDSGQRHRLTIRWRATGDGPASTRTVTIRRAGR